MTDSGGRASMRRGAGSGRAKMASVVKKGSDRARVLQVAVGLTNTIENRDSADQLQTLEQLRGLMVQWVVTDTPPPQDRDLADLRMLREQLRAAFAAPDDERRMQVINDLLAQADIRPRLNNHDGLGVHIHYFFPYATVSAHLRADCSMALALLVEEGEGDRLKLCAAPDCPRVLVDSSKNRSRIYCDSQTCGNRAHAAAYRARLAGH